MKKATPGCIKHQCKLTAILAEARKNHKSHLLQSQGRLETSQADCHLVVGGRMQTMQVAREPRQMSFNQPRPLGYVALPVSSSSYSRCLFRCDGIFLRFV